MKANELRLGNLVSLNVSNDPYIVLSIDKDGCLIEPINKKEEPDGEFFTNIEPIPLTEEWLLRFNAKLVKGIGWEHYYIDDDLSVDLSRKVAYICRYDEDAYPFPCEFVHQLQNLFYAKNNQELTINEKSPTI